jgi:hypothetical protein
MLLELLLFSLQLILLNFNCSVLIKCLVEGNISLLVLIRIVALS